MWNEEDNNPYGSFERPPSDGVASPPQLGPSGFETSPVRSGGVDNVQTLSDDDHVDTDEEEFAYARRRSYSSRIEQILNGNPDMPILITQAAKNADSGNYIVYTIRTGDLEVRRRYSEFSSLREAMLHLHPTVIVPPIPEKHTMVDYAAKPTKAKEDINIIDMRKRMLAVFLNRCRRMDVIREDDVWWRFLDPNASWAEVLRSPPLSQIPKAILRTPPLDPAHATPGHSYLPIPSANARLTGSEIPEPLTPERQLLPRFPASPGELSEAELDPYFINFEHSTTELETLLAVHVDKVNRRILMHLTSLANDLMDLGSRLNAFSLSEPSQSVATAIEHVGQAMDTAYIETTELSGRLGASFVEPMREVTQFTGIVRSVLQYRILKRIQEEMTREELKKKTDLLESLENSEQQARRLKEYMDETLSQSPESDHGQEGRAVEGDTSSIDSDFPPTRDTASHPTYTPSHRSQSSISNKIFGRISHAVHGFVDVDPERTRRDQIGKTKESLSQLGQALEVSQRDVRDASQSVLAELKRHQRDKEQDMRSYMLACARCHLDWARKNIETWTDARDEIEKIEVFN